MAAEAGEQQQEQAPNAETGKAESAPAPRLYNDDQVNAFVAKARREVESKYEGFDDIKDKATQFDALTESTKSEVQRATETAAAERAAKEAAASESAAAKLENRRYKISAKKGLDPDLWDRVTGSTDEEITADVEALVTKFGSTAKPAVSLRSGASASNAANPKERAASALRAMRQNN